MQATHVTNQNNASHQTLSRGTLPPQQNGTIGVLILHGFTSSQAAVSGLTKPLDNLNIPWEMPVLRGHNATPEALKGVTAQDWYDDARNALKTLATRVDHVIVVGLSMGGLVALNLCTHAHEYKIVACVTWAAALNFCNPFAWLAKPLSRFFPTWKGQDSFHDPECRKHNENYKTFPTKAFVELYDFAAKTRTILSDITVPLLIIHSKRDQVVPYKSAQFLFNHVSSDVCQWHSLSRSGHELGQDCQAQLVFKLTTDFIKQFMTKTTATS